jgi:hypothetical protein
MYLVTVTPAMLNAAIEKIPNMTKNRRTPFENIALKYESGLYMYGID